MLDLYKESITYNFEMMAKGNAKLKRVTKQDIEILNNKINKVRELLINDQISSEDYAAIKKQLEENIYSLTKKMNSFDKRRIILTT